MGAGQRNVTHYRSLSTTMEGTAMRSDACFPHGEVCEEVQESSPAEVAVIQVRASKGISEH